VLPEPVLFDPNNSFGLEGYLAMLVGMDVPHGKPWKASAAEQKIWNDRLTGFGEHAKRGFGVAETLAMIRQNGVR
jgi:tryptophan halogenase